MRIYPPVTPEEARDWLAAQAAAAWGEEAAAALAGDVATLAEAMSTVSSVQLPDDLEPLFP
jgi:hypothetical protein